MLTKHLAQALVMVAMQKIHPQLQNTEDKASSKLWFRVSHVAAIRLGLQSLKGSAGLENPFPGSLCVVGAMTWHFTA